MATVPKISSSLGISKNLYVPFLRFSYLQTAPANCFRGKVVLTFEPLGKIPWCGQLNESSLVELANGAICFFFFFNVFGKLSRENLLNDFDEPILAEKGLIQKYLASIFRTACSG